MSHIYLIAGRRRIHIVDAIRCCLSGTLLCIGSEIGCAAVAAEYSDVTLCCASDSHYGYDCAADLSRAALQRINALPGQPYPAAVGGGAVDGVRGVLFLGDLTHNGTRDQWSSWTNDWGLNGERLLGFPVYEAYGNHDCGFDAATGSDAENLSIVPDGIKARNLLRSIASSASGDDCHYHISANGYHYSWDWDYLHVVCLNLFPGQGMIADTGADSRDSLLFLEDDLARHVRGSGRPVLIYSHENPFDSGVESDLVNCWDAILKYNVVGLFAGHGHTLDQVSWWGGFNIYQDGNLGMPSCGCGSGNFLVVHLAGANLVVAEWTETNTWGAVWSQTIPCPTGICLVSDPESTNVTAGSSVKLTVEAAGPALAYQWLFNGTHALAGATNSTLWLSNVGPAQSGTYVAVVSNQSDSVASAPAVVTVNPPAKAWELQMIAR